MSHAASDNNIVLDVIEENGQYRTILPEARIFSGSSKEETISKSIFPEDMDMGQKWIPWGDNDSLPTEIRQKIESVPIAGSTIYKLMSMMYGNGLAYYRDEDKAKAVEAGEKSVKRAYDQQIEDWLRKSRIPQKWLVPQFTNYRMTMNSFSEFILSKNKKYINGMYHKEAEFCRLEVQNERTLNIDNLYYSAKFGSGMEPTEKEAVKIPLFNWYEEDIFFEKLKKRKFAYHTRFETPGIIYYARPFWVGLFRKNGWLDASAAVPEIVNSMMRNQIRLKYQILIPESYFEVRYQDWKSKSDEFRNKKIDELIAKINKKLTDTKNAYASIATVFKQDLNGNDRGKIDIVAIDDKIKKDSWVPSSTTADAQIVQGLGLHPSQMGLAPEGGKMGAGSGSDQRESFNTNISLNTIDQEIVLEPLNFVSRFNKWGVTFFIDHTHHTTTNDQESGLKPSSTTIEQ